MPQLIRLESSLSLISPSEILLTLTPKLSSPRPPSWARPQHLAFDNCTSPDLVPLFPPLLSHHPFFTLKLDSPNCLKLFNVHLF